MNFLAKVGLWLYFNLRIYILWSRLYQFIWQRNKRLKLKRFVDIFDFVDYIKTFKWKADGLRELFDAFSHPEHVQWLAEYDSERYVGDCLPENTQLLMSDFSLKSIKDIQIDDVIVDSKGFTKVTKKFPKSFKQLLKIKLNNGETLECSPEHKLFVVPRNKNGYHGESSNKIELKAEGLKVGDDLLQPESFPQGQIDLDEDIAWSIGVFVADGWIDGRRACISGKDGHKKESQKNRLKQIFKETSWHSRYIRIYDKDFLNLVADCGRSALNKKFPFVNVTKKTAINFLKGLEADACVKSGVVVYGTISTTLKNQIKILCRIAGFSCHVKTVDNHGGLGKNPIFRITVRGPNTTRKFARIKEITQHANVPMYDIETETHSFYLPESDVIVHNCDEFSIYESNILYNELFNLNKNFINEGMVGSEILTVCWRDLNENKFNGHNVCLIKYSDGKFSYMDYGFPSRKIDSVDGVVEMVIEKYTKNYKILGWSRMLPQMRLVETKMYW